MKTKIIFRPDTNERAELKRISDGSDSDAIVIPESMKILIKERDGFWKEVGKKRFKIGELEVED